MTTTFGTEDAPLDFPRGTGALADADAADFIGDSPEMQQVRHQLAQLALTDKLVLLLGETGTGKGLAARRLHALSPWADGPFVQVNCGSLSEYLLESELFGHERGAFTGAVARKPGRVELARGGTLFLDEIGELRRSAQVKLLHLLADGVYQRVGGTETLRAQARFVAATNRDLRAEVARGRFREDLFHRLNVLTLPLPSLRIYPSDILGLAHHFVAAQAADLGLPAPGLSREAEAALLAYHGPGNVRELKHTVQRSVVTCPGPTIRRQDLPPLPRAAADGDAETFLSLEENERQHIRRVLAATRGVIKGDRGAAAVLKVRPSTLYYRIRKLGVVLPSKQQRDRAAAA